MGLPVFAHSRRRLSRSLISKGVPKRSARSLRFWMSASMVATSASRAAASAASSSAVFSFFAGAGAAAAARAPPPRAPPRRAPPRRAPPPRAPPPRAPPPRVRPDPRVRPPRRARHRRGYPRALLPPPPRRARPRRRRRLLETLEEHSLDARGVQALLLARVAEFLETSHGRGGRGGGGERSVRRRVTRVVKVASRSRKTASGSRSESADDSAASGRDIPAPRTRADRGSRRDVNARGSSVGSFEHSPGLSSSCTRPCQPSRRSASFGGYFTNCKVGTTIFCRERDKRSVRRAGRALDDSRGRARCQSDEIEDPRALGVVRRDGADCLRSSFPRNFEVAALSILGRREVDPVSRPIRTRHASKASNFPRQKS